MKKPPNKTLTSEPNLESQFPDRDRLKLYREYERVQFYKKGFGQRTEQDNIVRIIKNAINDEYIDPDDLAIIMGNEKYSESYLLNLWNKFHLEIKNPKKFDLTTIDGRVFYWTCLLDRWTGQGIQRELPALLDKYQLTTVTQNKESKIKLSDFKYFLKIINSSCKVSLLLPNILYQKEPAEVEAGNKVEDNKEKNEHYESLIEQFKISYESDNEIKIQEPKKKWVCYTLESIFGDSTKTKDDFLNILKSSDQTYCLGKAKTYSRDGAKEIEVRNKEYDAKRKRLESINKKLTIFFNKTFTIDTPNNFKLYKLCSDKPEGTYRFRFNVIPKESIDIKPASIAKYNAFRKDEILSEIKKLSFDGASVDELKYAVDHAKSIGITDSELEKSFNLMMTEEDNENYDPNEYEEKEEIY